MCRCTARKRSSAAQAWPSRARLWHSGAVSAACSSIRTGEHARAFLGDWRGQLVCDDFAGYSV
ncbi:IS66 family transposase [Pseudomonas aeruginosa]|uniref:IS66 family transposase n=1 Tax=Pseudomonas aeruginosa TaxID=287 RepID=UPI003C6E4B8A